MSLTLPLLLRTYLDDFTHFGLWRLTGPQQAELWRPLAKFTSETASHSSSWIGNRAYPLHLEPLGIDSAHQSLSLDSPQFSSLTSGSSDWMKASEDDPNHESTWFSSRDQLRRVIFVHLVNSFAAMIGFASRCKKHARI